MSGRSVRSAAIAFSLFLGGVGDAQEPQGQPTFFPAQAFAKDRCDGQFFQRWYSRNLAAMNEPRLSSPRGPQGGVQAEAYRFLWLRSFHHPIAVRVEKVAGEKARLFVKELDGKGGYAPGKLTIDRTRALTDGEWSGIAPRMDAARFWSMPADEQSWYKQDNGIIVAWSMKDGAEWILEGAKGSGYHVVTRTSPDDSVYRKLGRYREVGLHFLWLAGLDKERVY